MALWQLPGLDSSTAMGVTSAQWTREPTEAIQPFSSGGAYIMWLEVEAEEGREASSRMTTPHSDGHPGHLVFTMA
jgi:hypothetical protein